MKWISKDVQTFLSAKEYIDTAIVPLYSISLEAELKQSAEAVEFISLLTAQVERQFAGRLLLLPPFTYLKKASSEITAEQLKNWELSLAAAGFQHIFYLTADAEWRRQEEKYDGSFIWLPAIPLESMSDGQKITLVDSQVSQLLPLFTQKWQENQGK
ncbi:YpiF family protein [Neobacillus dielmonensis]|uniref:YpiF family protein n=1 Tax=Neobacillus dielmonensis TaxID=1347369 RepID=UPI0005A8355E|nr:YpiF family protein [Neobacillus dielmonensis]